MKKAKIFMYSDRAGTLIEDENGYHFTYEKLYLENEKSDPISLTLPKISTTYTSKILFPFFDGLIPEGWLLDIVEKNSKLNVRDRMSILLVTCKDCIGAVTVESFENENHE